MKAAGIAASLIVQQSAAADLPVQQPADGAVNRLNAIDSSAQPESPAVAAIPNPSSLFLMS